MRDFLSVVWRKVLLLPPSLDDPAPPLDPAIERLHEQVRAEFSTVRIRRAPQPLDWKQVAP